MFLGCGIQSATQLLILLGILFMQLMNWMDGWVNGTGFDGLHLNINEQEQQMNSNCTDVGHKNVQVK